MVAVAVETMIDRLFAVAKRCADSLARFAPLRWSDAEAFEDDQLARFSPLATPAPGGDAERGELPRTYGVDHALLLARDPAWLFACWEVTVTTRARMREALGTDAERAHDVLRVHDVTAGTTSDVDLPRGASSWYLHVERPATVYRVDVGVRTLAGVFIPLVSSAPAATPPLEPSAEEAPVRWVTLAGDGASRSATPAPTP